MILGRYMQTPHYVTYVNLLWQLHELIAAGKGDDDEADAIRDQMDGPWRHLDEGEIARSRELSADLYTLSETHEPKASLPDAVKRRIEISRDDGDWDQLLRLLREHQNAISAADAAGLRGICWASLKQFDVAVEFFEQAMRLSPSERMYQLSYLTCLVTADRLHQAVEEADRIIESSSDPARLFKAAEIYFVQTTTSESHKAAEVHRKAIKIAEKALALANKLPADSLLSQFAFYAHLNCSLSYKELGEHDLALKACREAIALDPTNLEALVLQEGLEPSDASAGMARRAIAERTTPGPIVGTAISSSN